MGDIMPTITARQLADQLGVHPHAMEKRVRRKYPQLSPAMSAPLSAEHIAELSKGRGTKSATTVRKFRTVAPVTEKASATETCETREISAIGEGFKSVKKRQIALISLMIAPTLASVSNMYHVTNELTDALGAVCLTVLLSTSAVGFTLSGAKHRLAIAVTVATVLYEAFCNLVRIYGGLMQGQNGNPTKFLGLVTDILPTGSHASAVILGVITAGLISGVQYAAIFEMQTPASPGNTSFSTVNPRPLRL